MKLNRKKDVRLVIPVVVNAWKTAYLISNLAFCFEPLTMYKILASSIQEMKKLAIFNIEK